MDNQIHHFDDVDIEIYLTEEEHNLFAKKDDNKIYEVDSEQYQRGYLNAMDDFQKKLKLRSRDIVINKGRPNTNQPSNSETNTKKQVEN